MNRYRLLHITEFQYDGPVSESYNEVRLRPMQDERQSCLSFRLIDRSRCRSLRRICDFFGNWVHQFNVLPRPPHAADRNGVRGAGAGSDPLARPRHHHDELDERREDVADDFYDLIIPTDYTPHVRR